jgi:steroid delta-isomerase-like uncharacterized protein
MSEENKLVTRRHIEEVLSQGNLDLIDELFASDFVGHAPSEEKHGPEAMKKFVSGLRRAFPDLRVAVEDQIAEGDKVTIRWTALGTHKGEFQGMPPTGKQMTMTAMTLARIANGKIVEAWTERDTLGMLQQLGAVPVPAK